MRLCSEIQNPITFKFKPSPNHKSPQIMRWHVLLLLGHNSIRYVWCKTRQHIKLITPIPLWSIMVAASMRLLWGCFLSDGTGDLVKIEGNHGSIQIPIHSITKPAVLCQTSEDDENCTFQHDIERKKVVNVLEWSCQRPNLKSFKTLWNDYKRAVHRTSPHNLYNANIFFHYYYYFIAIMHSRYYA